jgi:hypothetical protein
MIGQSATDDIIPYKIHGRRAAFLRREAERRNFPSRAASPAGIRTLFQKDAWRGMAAQPGFMLQVRRRRAILAHFQLAYCPASGFRVHAPSPG